MSTVALVAAPILANLNDAAPKASARARRDGQEPMEVEGAGVMRLSLYGCSIEIGELKGFAPFSILGC